MACRWLPAQPSSGPRRSLPAAGWVAASLAAWLTPEGAGTVPCRSSPSQEGTRRRCPWPQGPAPTAHASFASSLSERSAPPPASRLPRSPPNPSRSPAAPRGTEDLLSLHPTLVRAPAIPHLDHHGNQTRSPLPLPPTSTVPPQRSGQRETFEVVPTAATARTNAEAKVRRRACQARPDGPHPISGPVPLPGPAFPIELPGHTPPGTPLTWLRRWL